MLARFWRVVVRTRTRRRLCDRRRWPSWTAPEPVKRFEDTFLRCLLKYLLIGNGLVDQRDGGELAWLWLAVAEPGRVGGVEGRGSLDAYLDGGAVVHGGRVWYPIPEWRCSWL